MQFHTGRLIDHDRADVRRYHPGYFGAFVLDPDANNIEAVFHGASRRSAESVLITRAGP